MDNNTIALISLIISGISLLITIIFNIITQYKAIKDNEPQLSFSLRNYNNTLLLMVHNKGGTKAKNIRINIEKIHNNGNYGIQEDYIFNIPFELAADEKVQGMVAFYGENISNHVFPYIDIQVNYEKPHFIRKVSYKRQVFFIAQTESKITVDTKLDISTINKNMEKMHKSILRLSNYFDGCEVSPFDELNIISQNHFQQDLKKALDSKLNKPITREECIRKNRRKTR